MAKRKRLLKIFLGILIGITLSQLLTMSKLLKDLCGGVGVGGVSDEQQQQTFIKQPQHPSSNKSLLFVGVMTAGKYLNTRAKAVYDTWGRDVPGKIVFFSSEYSYSHQVPLVPLIGVDDSYPPQKKSFMMLKYMYDNYLDQYEWFLRADDDVYIRTDRLEELLRSVDSKKAWFIGQTGRGNSEEFGLLSLDNDENFCMGGPGVILSRETLRRMAPYVEDCLTNLYTTHEDVELGRCVKRFAGISCTWSYEASPNCACKAREGLLEFKLCKRGLFFFATHFFFVFEANGSFFSLLVIIIQIYRKTKFDKIYIFSSITRNSVNRVEFNYDYMNNKTSYCT